MSGDYDDDKVERMSLQVWKTDGRYWVDLDLAIAELEAHPHRDDPCITMTLGWFRNARAVASEHLE